MSFFCKAKNKLYTKICVKDKFTLPDNMGFEHFVKEDKIAKPTLPTFSKENYFSCRDCKLSSTLKNHLRNN